MKLVFGEYLIGAGREERVEERGLHALHGGRTEKLKQGSVGLRNTNGSEGGESEKVLYNFSLNFTGQ
ncbi:hypothetical protein TSUD_199550 [Trifolium subterraneum]|nr:hypothetical protein TSUD_199550 [Trifolium subterraneum]